MKITPKNKKSDTSEKDGLKKNNLEEFYDNVSAGAKIETPSMPKISVKSFKKAFTKTENLVSAADTASTLAELAQSGAGAPGPTLLADIASAGKGTQTLLNCKTAKNTMQNAMGTLTKEESDAVSDIIDYAFDQSGTVGVMKYWGDKVDIEKRAQLYNDVAEVVHFNVSPEQLPDAVPALSDALATHLKNAVVQEKSTLSTLGREGGVHHMSLNEKGLAMVRQTLRSASMDEGGGYKFKQEKFTDLESDKPKNKKTKLEDAPHYVSTYVKPTDLMPDIVKFLKAAEHAEKDKAGEAALHTGDVLVSVIVAAATQGVASPLVGLSATKATSAGMDAKKCSNAIDILRPSAYSANDAQLNAASEIVGKAFLEAGLVDPQQPKAFTENMDIEKTATVYAKVIDTLVGNVSNSQLENAKPALIKALADHLNEASVDKSRVQNVFKPGGHKEHQSYDMASLQMIDAKLSAAVGTKFKDKDTVILGAEEPQNMLQRQAAENKGSYGQQAKEKVKAKSKAAKKTLGKGVEKLTDKKVERFGDEDVAEKKSETKDKSTPDQTVKQSRSRNPDLIHQAQDIGNHFQHSAISNEPKKNLGQEHHGDTPPKEGSKNKGVERD